MKTLATKLISNTRMAVPPPGVERRVFLAHGFDDLKFYDWGNLVGTVGAIPEINSLVPLDAELGGSGSGSTGTAALSFRYQPISDRKFQNIFLCNGVNVSLAVSGNIGIGAWNYTNVFSGVPLQKESYFQHNNYGLTFEGSYVTQDDSTALFVAKPQKLTRGRSVLVDVSNPSAIRHLADFFTFQKANSPATTYTYISDYEKSWGKHGYVDEALGIVWYLDHPIRIYSFDKTSPTSSRLVNIYDNYVQTWGACLDDTTHHFYVQIRGITYTENRRPVNPVYDKFSVFTHTPGATMPEVVATKITNAPAESVFTTGLDTINGRLFMEIDKARKIVFIAYDNGKMCAMDVSNPAAPSQLSYVSHAAHMADGGQLIHGLGLSSDGQFAGILFGAKGTVSGTGIDPRFILVDISDPTNMQVVGKGDLVGMGHATIGPDFL